MIDSVSNSAGASADLKKARLQKASSTVNFISRLPPHSIEAEQGVLGCCLLSPNECTGECVENLKDGHTTFYDLRHQEIYQTLMGMFSLRIPVDVISLQQWLKDNGVLEQCGGIAYLSQLQDAVPSAANLSYYLDIVREKHLLRKMIRVCTDAVGRIYDYEGDVQGLLDAVERDILAVRPVQNNSEDILELVGQAIQKIEHKISAPDAMTGLSTGLTDLDRLTDGMHAGEMITVAALPSRGKSCLAANILVHNALQGIPGAIFTAEMKPVQLVVRSICSESRVNFRHVTELDVPKMTVVAGRLANAPLYIIQSNRWQIGKLVAVARRLKQKFNIQLGAVDYIQLLMGTGDNLEQQVSSISKGIKSMSLELDMPVLALSQLNEKGETKYARAISEDTDSLWRLDNCGEWHPTFQLVDLFVEKSRDGETGKVPLLLLKDITRFMNAAKVSDDDVPMDR